MPTVGSCSWRAGLLRRFASGEFLPDNIISEETWLPLPHSTRTHQAGARL